MEFNITKDKNNIIELDCGKIIIDKEYLDIIFNIKKWNIGFSTCYNGKMYLISHFVLDRKPPKGFVIDHINCNPLDNRKQNLRLITKQQNCYNRSIKANKKSSIYKGVCKNFNKWTSSVKGQFLGNFNTEKEAAEIYDKKAKELYGDFAYLNFPEPGQEKYKQELTWKENEDNSVSIDFGRLIIDKEDYDRVINKRWQIRIISSSKHKDLHFYIIEKKNPKNIIDHIDGNQLNNRKENLREISKGQNSYNMYIRSNCISKYKGVTFDKQTKKWVASIMYNRKRYGLGYFINEKDAGLEYNKFAKLYFGECARLNIIEE